MIHHRILASSNPASSKGGDESWKVWSRLVPWWAWRLVVGWDGELVQMRVG